MPGVDGTVKLGVVATPLAHTDGLTPTVPGVTCVGLFGVPGGSTQPLRKVPSSPRFLPGYVCVPAPLPRSYWNDGMMSSAWPSCPLGLTMLSTLGDSDT